MPLILESAYVVSIDKPSRGDTDYANCLDLIMFNLKLFTMMLQVAYCTTEDGTGKDERAIIAPELLKNFSSLPFNVVKAYSIYKADNNLIQCVCDYLKISSIQLYYIEFIF